MVESNLGETLKETTKSKNEKASEKASEFEQSAETSTFDYQWEEISSDFNSNNKHCSWKVNNSSTAETESPGTWDPNAFDQQAPNSWKEPKAPKRIQDIGSPLLVEPETLAPNSDEEAWPFTSPCKMEEKRRNRMTPKTDDHSESDIDSEEEMPKTTTRKGKDSAPKSVARTVSDEKDEDDDIKEELEEFPARGEASSSRRGRRRDHDLAPPRRSRADDEEEEEDEDDKVSSKDGDEGSSSGRPRKPRRSRSKDDGVEGEDDDAPDQGAFDNLQSDFDKKPSRSSSRGRRTRTPTSGGSGRRRRMKDKAMDSSDHSAGGDADDIDDDIQQVKLKGDDDGTPGSGRRTWRERRAQKRMTKDQAFEGNQVLQAPGSGGRRPPSRRGQMRRASSERWMRAVEGLDQSAEGGDSSRRERNTELSRSGHSLRRFHSGGIGRMTSALGTASYHGMEGGSSSSRRTPLRRPRRKDIQTPNSDNSGARSFGEDYEYELNLSGRSARTLDSIEDLEDFEHIDFQTPGMINYDEEMLDLMQRANPEHTSHLQRRVGRKREAVNYDQNMPMMTRQALMTRTASTQVQRQFVDQSTIDRRRLLVRSMSNSSMAKDELSLSSHRQQQVNRVPSRRPPPRTRSSGMAALSRSEHPDRRQVFRTKSGTSTSSFRYNQKPNRVQSLSRRTPSESTEGSSSSRRGAPDDRRGSLARAQSMHATVGRAPRSISPKKPERRIPKSIETEAKKEEAKERKDDDSSSFSEDSDLETDEDSAASPIKVKTKRLVKPAAPPKPTPPKPKKKKTDKRDFSVRRNRSKLHYMLYERKMGVDMHDLLKQVQEGEVPRSPHKTLMMPSP